MSFFYLFDKSLLEYMYIELIWFFFKKKRSYGHQWCVESCPVSVFVVLFFKKDEIYKNILNHHLTLFYIVYQWVCIQRFTSIFYRSESDDSRQNLFIIARVMLGSIVVLCRYFPTNARLPVLGSCEWRSGQAVPRNDPLGFNRWTFSVYGPRCEQVCTERGRWW